MKVLVELTESELDEIIGWLRSLTNIQKQLGQARAYHKVTSLIERLKKRGVKK